ncbi:MAG: P-II family nitrogen regulator [Opitutaceae bacterium]
MKEIKAYIRPIVIEPVIRELEHAGARDMTIIRVDAFSTMSDGATDRDHFFRKYSKKYSAVAKLELVCRRDDALKFTKIIKDLAHTGAHGDGRIFVSDVNQAINVRSGVEGPEAL